MWRFVLPFDTVPPTIVVDSRAVSSYQSLEREYRSNQHHIAKPENNIVCSVTKGSREFEDHHDCGDVIGSRKTYPGGPCDRSMQHTESPTTLTATSMP